MVKVNVAILNSYVDSRVKRCMPPTNNSIEGFNITLFKTISQCHPNI